MIVYVPRKRWTIMTEQHGLTLHALNFDNWNPYNYISYNISRISLDSWFIHHTRLTFVTIINIYIFPKLPSTGVSSPTIRCTFHLCTNSLIPCHRNSNENSNSNQTCQIQLTIKNDLNRATFHLAASGCTRASANELLRGDEARGLASLPLLVLSKKGWCCFVKWFCFHSGEVELFETFRIAFR